MSTDELVRRLEEIATEQDDEAERLKGKDIAKSHRLGHLLNAGQLRALADGLARSAGDSVIEDIAKQVPIA
jgi:hypothetical protein